MWVAERCGLDRDMILPVRFSATAAGDAAFFYFFRLWLLRLRGPRKSAWPIFTWAVWCVRVNSARLDFTGTDAVATQKGKGEMPGDGRRLGVPAVHLALTIVFGTGP